MKKIKADADKCIWFYCDGWRYGKIIKHWSGVEVTVADCSESKYRCKQNNNGSWIATRSKEFKNQKHARKEPANGKEKNKRKGKKIRIKKRVQVKAKKRKVCKVRIKSKV